MRLYHHYFTHFMLFPFKFTSAECNWSALSLVLELIFNCNIFLLHLPYSVLLATWTRMKLNPSITNDLATLKAEFLMIGSVQAALPQYSSNNSCLLYFIIPPRDIRTWALHLNYSVRMSQWLRRVRYSNNVGLNTTATTKKLLPAWLWLLTGCQGAGVLDLHNSLVKHQSELSQKLFPGDPPPHTTHSFKAITSVIYIHSHVIWIEAFISIKIWPKKERERGKRSSSSSSQGNILPHDSQLTRSSGLPQLITVSSSTKITRS